MFCESSFGAVSFCFLPHNKGVLSDSVCILWVMSNGTLCVGFLLKFGLRVYFSKEDLHLASLNIGGHINLEPYKNKYLALRFIDPKNSPNLGYKHMWGLAYG